MALTARQQRFYTDRCDVWLPPGADGTALPTNANDAVTNLVYQRSTSPHFMDVPCMLQTEIESNNFRPAIGRTAMDNMFTLDHLYLEERHDFPDQTVVLMKEGSNLAGQWFITQGQGRSAISRGSRHANYRMLQLKRTNSPVEVLPSSGSSGFSAGFGSGYGGT